MEVNSNISVYPNPNNGLFNVNISIPVQSNIELQLLNVQGQVINIYNSNNVTEFNKEIDVTGLSVGEYFLKINTGNQIQIEKVIVK